MTADWAAWEDQFLAPWAAHSHASRGRQRPEAPDGLRTVWQHDRDRIIHSKAFRRLKHKTQVFINPSGDHFRTRLTHTLEVAQIARTISRALCLNEDLTEAIALGHDLGHTPFGHAGERALASVQHDFNHNRQGLRVVDLLENDGQGLNLTQETRDGILCHSGPQQPQTLEGCVVRFCDRIAYLNHDIDDAIRSGYLQFSQLPPRLLATLGGTHRRRIDTMVRDIVRESDGRPEVRMSAHCAEAMQELRDFMFQHVYFHPRKIAEEQRLEAMIVSFFHHFLANPQQLPPEYRREPLDQAVCDYIAGMTDPFALALQPGAADLPGSPAPAQPLTAAE